MSGLNSDEDVGMSVLLKSLCIISAVFTLQVFAKDVHMYEGDSLEIPDDWQFHRGNPLPQDQIGTLFSAVSVDGCGFRLDSAGVSQTPDKFATGVAQFDDYLGQLFARNGVKITSQDPSREVKLGAFRALEKNYEFEIQGAKRRARMLQFNSNHHLYNAVITSSSLENADECLVQGVSILNTVKSR